MPRAVSFMLRLALATAVFAGSAIASARADTVSADTSASDSGALEAEKRQWASYAAASIGIPTDLP